MNKKSPRPSVSREDYLERIHELIESKGYARPIEIAKELEISQSSVSAMVQKLAAEGWINYEKYRGLTLTEEGLKIAQSIRERHQILTRFLSLLSISESAQSNDIEGMEHHLSDETVGALAKLTDFLEGRPRLMREFRDRKA